METAALYPGKFYPFHEGHEEIVNQTLKVFDTVTILVCDSDLDEALKRGHEIVKYFEHNKRVGVATWNGLLAAYTNENPFSCIVRGLRNTTDLQYEKDLQYTHEDLGIGIPFVYFITSREKAHISGTFKRAIAKHIQ